MPARALIKNLPCGANVYREGKYFRVRLGKKFTGGQIVKRNFSSLGEAREFLFGEDAKKLEVTEPGIVNLARDAGTAAFSLSGRDIADATAARQLLDSRSEKMSLLDVAKFWLSEHPEILGDYLLSDAIRELLRHKVKLSLSKEYNDALRWALGKFARDFPAAKVKEITTQKVDRWLDLQDFGAQTRNNYIRDLKILFNFAKDRGWVSNSPLDRISQSRIHEDEVAILNLEQIRCLLGATAAPHLEAMRAAIAIELFAGLRASEVQRLSWSDIKSGEIVIQAKKTKTRKRRVVAISSNLEKWLKPLRKESGLIAPSRQIWRKALKEIAHRAGITPWPRNVLRHSFGSYFYAKHQNEHRTAAEMGNTPDVVFRHYRAVVSKNEAEAFWKIVPPKNLSAWDKFSLAV